MFDFLSSQRQVGVRNGKLLSISYNGVTVVTADVFNAMDWKVKSHENLTIFVLCWCESALKSVTICKKQSNNNRLFLWTWSCTTDNVYLLITVNNYLYICCKPRQNLLRSVQCRSLVLCKWNSASRWTDKNSASWLQKVAKENLKFSLSFLCGIFIRYP